MGLEGRRQRCCGAPGEPAYRKQPLGDVARALVRRVEREQLLDKGDRALGLVELVRIQLHDALQERLLRIRVRLWIGGQGLLVQAYGVPEATRLRTERFEVRARLSVAWFESHDLLP